MTELGSAADCLLDGSARPMAREAMSKNQRPAIRFMLGEILGSVGYCSSGRYLKRYLTSFPLGSSRFGRHSGENQRVTDVFPVLILERTNVTIAITNALPLTYGRQKALVTACNGLG
jgi:hypothetical protein